MSDIVAKTNTSLIESDVLNPSLSIDDRLQLAGVVANKFKTAIKQLGLIHNIKGNDYVSVSGWSTLGTMLGIHVENIHVEPFDVPRGFGYKAKVDLVDKNGFKIGEGEAIASSTGRQKEDHAVYSMAITRATGKAYRLCLAWLVEMAGYNATPYEEMPESMTNHATKRHAPKKQTIPKETVEVEEEVVIDAPQDNHVEPPELITRCIDALTMRGMKITTETVKVCLEGRFKNEDEYQECVDWLDNIGLGDV